MKPQIYVKLCLKMEIALFYKKCEKTMAMPWRHDLWEQIEHIIVNFGNT